jgi:maltose alpha-D-glucosyltransferase/alpha-amylase
VVYYGDEIGMGDNIYLGDRNGVRTPMQWSPDRNAGFSRANPQRLYQPVVIDPEYHYEAVNVEAQQNNPSSLLWWTKRLIALRKRYRAFSRGTLEFLYPANLKILAFVRRYEEETILVVANLARTVQFAELDLSAFQGLVPMELFGRTRFPVIADSPYFLTLGPHSFYWFILRPQRVPELDGQAVSLPALPTLASPAQWDLLLRPKPHPVLEGLLAAYYRLHRKTGTRSRLIGAAIVQDTIPVAYDGTTVYITLIRIEYTDGDPEIYALPLAFAHAEHADEILQRWPWAGVARLKGGAHGILYNAREEPGLWEALLELVAHNASLAGVIGELRGWTTADFGELRGPSDTGLTASIGEVARFMGAVHFGDRLVLRAYRRLEEGVSCDLEMLRFLQKAGFAHGPQLAGALEYQQPRHKEPMTLGILRGRLSSEESAWKHALDALGRYFEKALASQAPAPAVATSTRALLQAMDQTPAPPATDLLDSFQESARLLGQRTAELHLALASDKDDPAFQPLPFTGHYQRSIYQSVRNSARRVFQVLRRSQAGLPPRALEHVQQVLDLEEPLLQRYSAVLRQRIIAERIRIHGDYHLGQVLYTGRDFVIANFDGDMTRPLGERRLKHSPLRDVAAMLRSFYYVAHQVLVGHGPGIVVRPPDLAPLEPWARLWYLTVGSSFLHAYLAEVTGADFLPEARSEVELLLDIFLLDKSVHEVGHELELRIDWLEIPMRSLVQLLEAPASAVPLAGERGT